jgi:hypothetical protein
MECGWYTPRGWEAIPCATSAQIDALFPHPEYNPVALRSQMFANSAGANQTLPLLSAQLESTFTAVGPTGKVTDTPLTAPAAGSGCNKGTNTDNQWSVQVNTNQFKTSTGDNAAVQFAIQTKKLDDGSEINDVCVWNVDVTKKDYTKKFCAIPPAKKRAGGFKQFDSSNIYAYADPSDNTLHVIAKMSWVEAGQPYIYTAKSADTYGLIGNWTQVDGDVLGNGNCASAVFEDGTELTNRMSASTCKDDTDATSSLDSCPTPAFTPHATVANAADTLETNNLQHVAPPTFPPTFANDDLAVTNWTESTTGQCVDAKHIYVSDRVGDTGSVPSNQGGEAFWESPDIFLVESGTPVDVNGFATQSNVTPGGSFDVYVRVHNDYGCADMTGAKARVYLADPSALSTPWQSITNGQYTADLADPNGVRVPAGKSALIGPLPFTASSTDLGDGHKCLIAAIIADNEGPVANDFDAPNSNQVAQRNVQFGNTCDYPLTNATANADTVKLTLTATPPEQHPSLSQPPALTVSFDDPNSNWLNVWAAQPNNGTDFSLSRAGSKTVVRFGTNRVVLNAVPIAPGETRDSSSMLDLPLDAPLTAVQLQAALGSGKVLNGESCAVAGQSSPH